MAGRHHADAIAVSHAAGRIQRAGPQHIAFELAIAPAQLARAAGARTILNPAPAAGLEPSIVALADVRKAIEMFRQVNVEVLGVVENMSLHICSKCGHEEDIFGSGGGNRMAKDYGIDLLGSLPLDIKIREQADSGRPTVVADPQSEVSGLYKAVARTVAIKIAQKAKDFSAKFPTITVSKNT